MSRNDILVGGTPTEDKRTQVVLTRAELEELVRRVSEAPAGAHRALDQAYRGNAPPSTEPEPLAPEGGPETLSPRRRRS